MCTLAQAAVAAFAHGVSSKVGDASFTKDPKPQVPSDHVGPSAIPRKVVNSLAEDLSWAAHNFEVMKSMLVESPIDGLLHFGGVTGPIMGGVMTVEQLFGKAIQNKTVSFGYAGVDAPGCAIIQSLVAAMDRSGVLLDTSKPKALWAIEHDKHCQRELRFPGQPTSTPQPQPHPNHPPTRPPTKSQNTYSSSWSCDPEV